MSTPSLRELVEQGRQGSQAPAFAASLFTGSEVLDQHVSGKRRQDRGEPVAETDLFHLGSNLHAIVATAATRLDQETVLPRPAAPAWDWGGTFPDIAECKAGQQNRVCCACGGIRRSGRDTLRSGRSSAPVAMVREQQQTARSGRLAHRRGIRRAFIACNVQNPRASPQITSLTPILFNM